MDRVAIGSVDCVKQLTQIRKYARKMAVRRILKFTDSESVNELLFINVSLL